MTHVMIERAESLMVRLSTQIDEQGDPGGLYGEAYEQLADLADAFAAAQDVIVALRSRLEEAALDRRSDRGNSRDKTET